MGKLFYIFIIVLLASCSKKENTVATSASDLNAKYGQPIATTPSTVSPGSNYIQFNKNVGAQVNAKTGAVEGEFREPANEEEKSLNYWKRKFAKNPNNPIITYIEIKGNTAVNGKNNFELKSEDKKTGVTISVIYSSYKQSVIRIIYYGKK